MRQRRRFTQVSYRRSASRPRQMAGCHGGRQCPHNQLPAFGPAREETTMQRRQFMTGAAALGAALVMPAVARAQEMPSGPVKIVVGFPAGGGTDVLARLLGQKLGVLWNMPVIIENRAGAAGIIA